MRRIAIAAAVALLGLGPVGSALAQGRHDQMPHGVPSAQKAPAPDAAGATAGDQVVALKDGGTLVLRKDGTVYHANAAGRRVRMKDGRVMEGQDGARYLMKNDAVWKQITKRGSQPFSHP